MKIHFDNLFADFGHVSLNKKKESLCGDFYITEEKVANSGNLKISGKYMG